MGAVKVSTEFLWGGLMSYFTFCTIHVNGIISNGKATTWSVGIYTDTNCIFRG